MIWIPIIATLILAAATYVKTQQVMATVEQFRAELAGINESTNNIAADIQRLADQVQGGISAEDAEQVFSELQATAAKLRDVAATTPETEEPTEPEA